MKTRVRLKYFVSCCSLFMPRAGKAEGVQEFRRSLLSSSCFIAGSSHIKIALSNTANLLFSDIVHLL